MNIFGFALRDTRRMCWAALAVLCLSLLIHLAIYLIDHRSTSFVVLAVVVTAAALGGMTAALWITFRLSPATLTKLREHARRWHGAYLILAFGAVFILGLGMRPEWVYAHIAITLGVGFALGYDLLYAEMSLSRIWIALAGIVTLAVIFVRLYGLSVYPPLNTIDEPSVLSWAMSYVRTGRFFDPIIYYGGGDIQRFMLPVAWWIKIVGTGFWQVRLFFFLLIIPLIAITARVAYNLYGHGAGWLAALFMFCSAIVIDAARIRHDIGLALALAGSLLLYTEALKRDRTTLHFAAGLVMGWGLFAHYHAIGFGVAMTVSLYLPRYVARARRGQWMPERGMMLYILGGLLGAASVFAVQILPDWEGFLDRRQLRNPPSIGEYINVFLAFWGNIAAYSMLEFILVIAALAVALWRRRRADVIISLLIVLLHVALAFQSDYTWEMFYLVPITPVYAIAVAALFLRIAPQRPGIAFSVAVLILAANIGLTLQSPLRHLVEAQPVDLPTPPAATWIREHIAPENLIAAENPYYLFLTDYDFVSPETWKFVPSSRTFASQDAMWDEIIPDVVVIDPNFNLGSWRLFDPDYLVSRGYKVVAEFPGERYPVLVYERGAEND